MKTFFELRSWCEGASSTFDDPSAPICQCFFRWVENLEHPTGGADLACGIFEGEFCLLMLPVGLIPLPIAPGGPVIADTGVVAFGAAKIARGLWEVSPSLNMQGEVHAFIVLYGVPDPAPWEIEAPRIITPERDLVR